jgi:N4-gp56 family major capsid protein
MYAAISVYYNKLALDYLTPQLRLYQFADKRPLPKQSGVNAIWRRYTVPTADSVLTEGTAPTVQALSSVTVSAGLQQLGYVYGITDILELTAIDSQVEQAVKILADRAAISVETYVRNAIIDGAGAIIERVSGTASNTNTRGAISTVYSSDTMVASVVNHAAARLRRLNVKPFQDGYYIFIAHPHSAQQLRTESGTAGQWLDVYKYATPENIYAGEVGKLHGFRFIECGTAGASNDGSIYVGSAQSTSATSVCAVYNMAFGQGFFGVTEMEGGVQTYVKTSNPYDKSDPIDQNNTVGYKVTLASKLTNISAGCVVPTAIEFI